MEEVGQFIKPYFIFSPAGATPRHKGHGAAGGPTDKDIVQPMSKDVGESYASNDWRIR